MLHLALEGGDAVDEWLVEDNVVTVAIDVVSDLGWQGEKGMGDVRGLLDGESWHTLDSTCRGLYVSRDDFVGGFQARRSALLGMDRGMVETGVT